MLIGRPHAVSYSMAFARPVTILEIFSVEMCVTLTLTFRTGNVCSVTVCEIFTIKIYMTLTLTFRMKPR